MKTENDEQQIQKSVNDALDKQVHQISPETQARLAQRRRLALDHARNKTHIWQHIFRPVPLAAAFTFSLALLLVLPKVQEAPESPERIATQQFDDLLLLSEFDDDTLELLEEIEFAYWLTEEMDTQAEGETIETHSSFSRPQSVYVAEKANQVNLAQPVLGGFING